MAANKACNNGHATFSACGKSVNYAICGFKSVCCHAMRVCDFHMINKSANAEIEIAEKRELRTNRRMTAEHHDRVVAWVEANLKRLGMSRAELSRRSGIEASKIGHSLGKARRNFRSYEIEKMGEIFNNTFSGLKPNKLERVANFRKSESVVMLGQKIGLGFAEMSTRHIATKIPAAKLPKYIDTPQEAWPIEDDSADIEAPKGAFAIVVDYFDFRPALQIDDKVVITRYHPILFRAGDLSQAENTVRIVARDEDTGAIIFKSLSRNPAVKNIVYNPEDKSIQVAKLIIGWQKYEAY